MARTPHGGILKIMQADGRWQAIIVMGIILALLVAMDALDFGRPSGAPGEAGPAEEAAGVPAGWNAYRADQYGFRIAFPPELSVVPAAGSLFAPSGSAFRLLAADSAREPSIELPAKGDVPATKESDGIGVDVYGADRRAAAAAAVDADIERSRGSRGVFQIRMAAIQGEPIALYRVAGGFGPYWAGYVNRGEYLFLFTTQEYDLKAVVSTAQFTAR